MDDVFQARQPVPLSSDIENHSRKKELQQQSLMDVTHYIIECRRSSRHKADINYEQQIYVPR